MLSLENTYTYTARSAIDPREVVTFTLHNGGMSLDVAGSANQLERTRRSQAESEEAEREETKPDGRARPWFTPRAALLLERATEPFDLTDVEADAPGNGLRVTAWVRANNLRLSPLLFRMKQVDNPRAAADFVAEIRRRKAQASSGRKLPGLLDYWAGWALGGLMAVGGLAALLLPTRSGGKRTPENEI